MEHVPNSNGTEHAPVTDLPRRYGTSIAPARSAACARRIGIERLQFDRLGALALEFRRHHLAVPGLDDHAIAAADRRGGRYDDDIAVSISGQHRVAGDFERIGMLVVDGRKIDFLPALADRKSAVIEETGSRLPPPARSRARPAPPWRASSVMRPTKTSTLVPVATSALATDSVDGQRARPAGVTRFDLLNVVGSSPARLARPDGERPARDSQAIEGGPNLRMREHDARLAGG